MIKNTICLLKSSNTYQMKKITPHEAIYLSQNQADLIKKSFNLGMQRIKNQSDIINENNLFDLFFNYHKKIVSGQIINGFFSLKEEQEQMFHLIHSSNLFDEEKIFLEFCMGLSRFILAIQLISKFVFFLHDTGKIHFNQMICGSLYNHQINIQNNFFDHISIVSEIGAKLIDIISSVYALDDPKPAKYWSDVNLFYSKFKSLDELSKTLVSIQYIPKNNNFLSIMQTIHWRGFGGTGQILNQYKDLENLSIHAINHHSGYEIIRPFNKRMSIFKKPLDAMLRATQNMIIHFLEKRFPTVNDFQVHDFCSGPHYAAVRELFKKIGHKYFNLTVSDVDGDSLISLITEKNKQDRSLNFQIIDVMYIDLMAPLNQLEDDIDKYHLVTVNLGLHQLPIEKIYEALRYFTLITKTGGLISNLDASEKRHAQLMIIPGNIVDREGYVPYIDEMDLTKLITRDHTKNYVKLPYPIVKFTQKVINSIEPEIGAGPYMVSFYTPIKISLPDFNKLNQLWKLKRYTDCDRFIEKHVGSIF